jgi:EAL domain-containing protein (putative c-di-GMP-specific phosphodiesterase class I)/GGDEF domain-containing protein
VRILTRILDPSLQAQAERVAERLNAELHPIDPARTARVGAVVDAATPDGARPGRGGEAEAADEGGGTGAAGSADVVLVEMPEDRDLDGLADEAERRGAALVVVCRSMDECDEASLARAADWILLPAGDDEIEVRLATARQRSLKEAMARNGAQEDVVELLRYEELLHDRLTGFPTLPVMMEKARDLMESRGEVTILYIQFVWYEKIEEIYGWQKLDEVLESTAAGVKQFYRSRHPSAESLMMVSHIGDDDFILFTEQPRVRDSTQPARALKELTQELESHLRSRLEADHSEDIASLCGIYVGASTIFRNPKIRTERLIYRGIREASQAARGAKEWERSRKITDLKGLLRDGAVFMEYHPIIVTESEEVYGYEALARGRRSGLRSPEVLLDVASEANLLWELSRLLRKRAIEGAAAELEEGQYLFLNVDPHDFNDPEFRDLTPEALAVEDPERVVLEITERTAINDYPQFKKYLDAFRERGFRFAVDDAGSGYAGLGSIANLDPDYIKLDISLISNIDTNFLKQSLVGTLVDFAEDHGAMVVGEGVERREEFEAIRELGVHLTQGFLFHKPRHTGAER